jgi:hypothetical protein
MCTRANSNSEGQFGEMEHRSFQGGECLRSCEDWTKARHRELRRGADDTRQILVRLLDQRNEAD